MISLIAAISQNNCIGVNNRLPWHIPEDLKHFNAITNGKVVIMGRKTFQSIGKPLKKRKNIVISRKSKFSVPSEIELSNDLMKSINKYNKKNQEIFIIGGQEIYEQIINLAHFLYITKIHKEYIGDTFFPEINNQWEIISEEKHPEYTYLKYQKKYVNND